MCELQDLGLGGGFAVERESTLVTIALDCASNDRVSTVSRSTCELNLDMGFPAAVFYEFSRILRAPEVLYSRAKGSAAMSLIHPLHKVSTYLWSPSKTETYRTDQCTLPSSIRTDYHVEFWTRKELDRRVCHEISELHSNYSACSVTVAVVRRGDTVARRQRISHRDL